MRKLFIYDRFFYKIKMLKFHEMNEGSRKPANIATKTIKKCQKHLNRG